MGGWGEEKLTLTCDAELFLSVAIHESPVTSHVIFSKGGVEWEKADRS